jgi:hypothetical protein
LAASQRGDSGSERRSSATTTEPSAPITNIHRQPSMPSGAIGARPRARNPDAGTPRKPIVYAQAM